MMRILLIVIVVICFNGCSKRPEPSKLISNKEFEIYTSIINSFIISDSITSISNTDYEIYSTVINSFYGSDTQSVLLIDDFTKVHTETPLNPLQYLSRFRTEIKFNSFWDLSGYAAAATDFVNKNQRHYVVKVNSIHSLVQVKPLSSREKADIFKPSNHGFTPETDGWRIFYKRYPNAIGILTFSRVGINRENNRAVVYLGDQREWTTGEGTIIWLIKMSTGWKIAGWSIAWFS